jgi:hypothetical protein
MMESTGRGVLDRPVEPGDDSWGLFDVVNPGLGSPLSFPFNAVSIRNNY